MTPQTKESRRAGCVDVSGSAEARVVSTFGRIAEDTLLRRLAHVGRDEIVAEWGHDPWLCNYFVNLWEYVHGVEELTSYPYNVTIPIADVCNARCTFCTSWLEGTKVLALADLPNFAEVLKHARVLGIAGHGEPLAHPHCDELFESMSGYLDPRCQAYLITNGVFLKRRRAALSKVNITTYNVSLNATTPGTHDVVMGLGTDAFGEVMESVRELLKVRNSGGRILEVNISFVLNRDNVHELPDFIELGNSLGVNKIYLRTLTSQNSLPVGLNYHRLPPTLHPQFERYAAQAKVAIANSRSQIITDVESWSAPVFSNSLQQLITIQQPPEIDRKQTLADKRTREFYSKYYEDSDGVTGLGEPLVVPEGTDPDLMEDGANPYQRVPQLHCSFLYQDFIINDFNMRLIPCCYMASVPGFDVVRFDGVRPFFDYWNSAAFRTLRRRLREGPLYGACKKCPAQAGPPEPDRVISEDLNAVVSDSKFVRTFQAEGSELLDGLNRSIYGESTEPILKVTDKNIIFHPTTAKDHLSTPFFDVSEGGRWLRFRLEWGNPLSAGAEQCRFIFQDGNYANLPVAGGVKNERGQPLVLLVRLSEDVKSVRLVLMAGEKTVELPWRLDIEQAEQSSYPKCGLLWSAPVEAEGGASRETVLYC